MSIRERASYAWGRICSLFKKKKQETEVKIEINKTIGDLKTKI